MKFQSNLQILTDKGKKKKKVTSHFDSISTNNISNNSNIA